MTTLKQIFFLTVILFSFINSIAKPLSSHIPSFYLPINDTLPETREIETVQFQKVEEEALYPGGVNEWRSFLGQTLHADVPAKKHAPAGTYSVIIQFIIEKDGTLSDYKALTNYGFGMEAEVIRVLKKSPKWTPAKQNGKIVRAYRKQPVTFQVAEEEKKKSRSKNN